MRRVRARGSVGAPFLLSALLINPNGAITGLYIDSAFVSHGFLRIGNGVITHERAGCRHGARSGYAKLRNQPGGETTGFYFDGPMQSTVFLRDTRASSPHTMFRGAGTGPGQGTLEGAFTPDGTIMGVYIDADNVNHGFLLDKNGRSYHVRAPVRGTGRPRYTTLGDQYEWSRSQDTTLTDKMCFTALCAIRTALSLSSDVPGAANMGAFASIAPNAGGGLILLRREQRGSRLRARSDRTVTPARPLPLRKHHSLPESSPTRD